MALPMPLFDYTLWILFSLFVGIALALDLGIMPCLSATPTKRILGSIPTNLSHRLLNSVTPTRKGD